MYNREGNTMPTKTAKKPPAGVDIGGIDRALAQAKAANEVARMPALTELITQAEALRDALTDGATGMTTLPGPEQGVEGILRMADVFGPHAVYRFLNFVRLDQGAGGNTAAQARTQLLQQMLAEIEAAEPNLTKLKARARLADELGIAKGNRPNFFKQLQGQARPRK
jgi:hypothetical protein